MDQMEHNYKIKNYKSYEDRGPYEKTLYAVNRPQTYWSKKEQDRFCNRFTQIHWKSEKRPRLLPSQEMELRYLRKDGFDVISKEIDQRRDELWYRQAHTREVERKIDLARSEFSHKTASERPKYLPHKVTSQSLHNI